jgi:hypothetical protein
MGVVTTKSGAITNRDSTPRVLETAITGNLKEVVGTLEAAAGDSSASKYIMCTIPSNARVTEVLLFCDDLGSTGLADIGVYRTTEDGGSVVDADVFASAQALTSALAGSGTNIMHESTVIGYEDLEKQLWEQVSGGLTSDPGYMYDVVLTLTEAVELAGTITLKVRYVV